MSSSTVTSDREAYTRIVCRRNHPDREWLVTGVQVWVARITPPDSEDARFVVIGDTHGNRTILTSKALREYFSLTPLLNARTLTPDRPGPKSTERFNAIRAEAIAVLARHILQATADAEAETTKEA